MIIRQRHIESYCIMLKNTPFCLYIREIEKLLLFRMFSKELGLLDSTETLLLLLYKRDQFKNLNIVQTANDR